MVFSVYADVETATALDGSAARARARGIDGEIDVAFVCWSR